jgi:hypothetical protein
MIDKCLLMGNLPFGTLGTTMIKTNLFWVVPRQLTKSVPTLVISNFSFLPLWN